MNTETKTLSEVRAIAGCAGGKIGGKIGGKSPKSVYSQSVKNSGHLSGLDFPVKIKREIIAKYGSFSDIVYLTMIPELNSLEKFEKPFPPEYASLLKSTEWGGLKKESTRFFEDFLFRIEKLVGKRNRSRFIAAYCLMLLEK